MDETYETNENTNDSITEVKQIEQTKDKCKSTTATAKSNNNTHVTPTSETINNVAKSKTQSTNNKKSNKKQESLESETDILCVEACSTRVDSPSIRCNLCMTWFHTACVGTSDVDGVGAWVCADCRIMPETIKLMKSQINTLLETTTSLMKTFGNFAEKLDREFGD